MNVPFNCLVCKGRDCKKYCKDENCPTCQRFKTAFSSKEIVSGDSFAGFSPTPFVGRFNYPHVNVGIMASPQEDYERDYYDNPKGWSKNSYDMPSLVDIRSSLINSRWKSNVLRARTQEKLLELGQEIAIAKRPADVEVQLADKPRHHMSFSSHTAPQGPIAQLEKAEITSNPNAEMRLEKVADENDLNAVDAVEYLAQNGIDENSISRALSVGLLGVKVQRKLTPTRWSITATDDMLGKRLIQDIGDYQETDPCFYFGGYLGNYYLMLFFPGIWGYELFEMYAPDSKVSLQYSTDHENHKGRTAYADNTAGGYYTVRLAVAEKMRALKRRGTVIALRFITEEYTAPLGVWVTREAARKALTSNKNVFSDKELMVEFAKAFVKKKFGVDVSELFRKSVLYRQLREQRRLGEY